MTKPIFNLPLATPGTTTKQILDGEANRVITELYDLTDDAVIEKAAEAAASAASAAASSAAAGASSGRLDVGAFGELATKFVYADPGAGQQIAAAGDIVLDRSTGIIYPVLASGASGAFLDYTGSGGVKFDQAAALGFINTKERAPILGNRAIANPIGEVNFGMDRELVFADGASWAGTFHSHRMELDGVNDYQLLAGTYLASLNVVNNGSGWQDAATLYIQGQPNDPADQDGSTSFALFINSGFSRIRDRVVIGNFDFSQDVLTVNGGSGTDYTLTVRNEGVAQPYMFRIIEPVKSGTSDAADPGFPMMRLQPFDGVGSYFEARTGGEILTTQFGSGAWTDDAQGTDTEYFLGVDTNGKWRETRATRINNFGIGEAVAHEGTISVAGGKKVVFLNGTASPSTYTLPAGSDGQHLILKAVATGVQTHTISGSFMRDPDDFPNVNQGSVSMLGFESVEVVFRAQGTNRWEVVGRTKR